MDFFDGTGDAHEAAPNFPEGFRYRPELISPADEDALLARVRELLGRLRRRDERLNDFQMQLATYIADVAGAIRFVHAHH
jgi:hypothetical protein